MAQQADRTKVELNDGMIEITLAPHQSSLTVEETNKQVERLLKDGPRDILVDASRLSRGDGTGLPHAINALKTLPFKRFAFFGGNPRYINIRIKELTETIGEPERLKFFRREENAREWLATKVGV